MCRRLGESNVRDYDRPGKNHLLEKPTCNEATSKIMA